MMDGWMDTTLPRRRRSFAFPQTLTVPEIKAIPRYDTRGWRQR